jgi:threonine dehydrogenase-like Zn-dependent dehydrogenase
MHAIDRRQFPDLQVDEQRYATDPAYKRRYRASEEAFLGLVHDRTHGQGVSIFLDYIGSPVVRATLKAIGRQGVIATAGWKGGALTPTHRAIECIHRRIHVHTHAFRRSDPPAATAYAEHHGWLPRVTGHVYTWDEIPRLADDFAAGRAGSYFPIFVVNPV